MEVSIQSAIVDLNHQIRRLEIQVNVISMIKTICQEINQEVGSIKPHTKLSFDLDFESLEIIQFIFNLEKKYRVNSDIADILMRNSQGTEDISIEQIVDLIDKNSG